MIHPDRMPGALRAIQWLVIWGRRMAHDGEPHERIAALLDHTEYLPSLILSAGDETESFRRYLDQIAVEFPGCARAVELYAGQRI